MNDKSSDTPFENFRIYDVGLRQIRQYSWCNGYHIFLAPVSE